MWTDFWPHIAFLASRMLIGSLMIRASIREFRRDNVWAAVAIGVSSSQWSYK